MKKILLGMVLGAIAVTAVGNKTKESMVKKSKKAILKKVEDIMDL